MLMGKRKKWNEGGKTPYPKDIEEAEIRESIKRIRVSEPDSINKMQVPNGEVDEIQSKPASAISHENVYLRTTITTKEIEFENNYYENNSQLGRLVQERIESRQINEDEVNYAEMNAFLGGLRRSN